MTELGEKFCVYQNKPIALYGLGVETQRAIAQLEGFRIVGLLDSFAKEGTIYDKTIMPLQECIRQQVKLIIVVARPGSCRAIVQNIGDFCRQNQIALFDVRGKDLLVQNKVVYDLQGIEGITKKQLWECILEKEVISFDLFDTLLMREVLFATDIVALTECKLREKGIYIEDFVSKRLQAEKELSKEKAPVLEEIYQEVLDKSKADKISAKELAEIEWEIDYSTILPRKEMVALLMQIKEKGKAIYLVTDTYYRTSQLEKMLKKCGIVGYTEILASCEYGISKTQGLFYKLQEKIQTASCLHIGDDVIADIESAKKAGMDAVSINSGIDLLEKVGYLGMENYLSNLFARIKLGMFVARIFNSPFQFETEERKLFVDTAEDIGYLLIAPMLSDFVIWFAGKIKEEKLENVWLSARDGYLLKKMYDRLTGTKNAVYFLTSRIAAIRAGMQQKEDIAYVADIKFTGTLQKLLQERFDISAEETETEQKSLQDFSEEILDKAKQNRENYKAYIKKLQIQSGDIAFFDFVAKGTTQLYVSRLVENHFKGFYFLQLEKEYMKDKNLEITAFYENEEMQNRTIFEDYYILETVLTSDEASIVGFDEIGNPLYGKETRNRKDIECFLKIQNGILSYFDAYLKICPALEESINREMDEAFLNLIHKMEIKVDDFVNFKVEDIFVNRMTSMDKLL